MLIEGLILIGILKQYDNIKQNINKQIIVAFTILLFVIISTITVVSIYHQKKELSNEIDKRGLLLLTTLSNTCRLGIYSENIKLLQNPLEGSIENRDVLAVGVYNNKWESILNKSKQKTKTYNIGQRVNKEIKNLLRDEDRTIVRTNNFIEFWCTVKEKKEYQIDTEIFYERKSVAPTENIIGYIVVVMDIGFFNERVGKIVFQNILTGVVLWLIGLWVTYKASNTFTLPVKELTEAVRQIENSGFGAQVKVHTKNEIGQLAEAFNHMSLTIEQRDIKNKQLEQQIWQKNSRKALKKIKHEIGNELKDLFSLIEQRVNLILRQAEKGINNTERLYELQAIIQGAVELMSKMFKEEKKETKNALLEDTVEKFHDNLVQRCPESAKTKLTFKHNTKTNLLVDREKINILLRQISIIIFKTQDEQKQQFADYCVESKNLSNKDVEKIKLSPGHYVVITIKNDKNGDIHGIETQLDPYFVLNEKLSDHAAEMSIVYSIARALGISVTLTTKNKTNYASFKIYFKETVQA